jgi:2-polyprenyl-3-methyl-5-hydroxy-6-metoxy-1,4-benzoquinol methylase
VVPPNPREEVLAENLWGYQNRLRFVLSAISKSAMVLDIGCGNGTQLAIPLSKMGYRVTAVDPDADSVKVGQSFSSAVHFIHGTVESVPSGRFDAVILSEVLEHLHHPERLLAAAVERISPGGVLIITVPNGYGEFELDRRTFQALRLQWIFEALSDLGRWLLRRSRRTELASSEDRSPHVQRFTQRQLKRMFGDYDLIVIDQRATSFVSGPMVAYTLGRIPGFVKLNVRLASILPMWMSSGWMFALRVRSDPP